MIAKTLTRRAALSLAAAPALFSQTWKPRLGAMDGTCGKAAQPAAVELAARCGLEGLQVSIGRLRGEGLVLSDQALQDQFLAASRQHHLPLLSTCLDVLHQFCLKNSAEAVRWVAEGIAITARLKAPVLLLPFFGNCALTTKAEIDAVIGPLKELAPQAQRAGVILGLENTIPAAEDLRILDAVSSPALQVYYDIGNATNLYNVDPLPEIAQLRGRLCQVHIKDKGYLGEGKVDVAGALRQLRQTGYRGDLVLETSSPSKDIEADLRRNRQFLAAALQS